MSRESGRVFVVDGDEDRRQARARILRRRGYAVSEIGLGGIAIDLVSSESPDLVLLDIDLPDGSGIEVCGRIKAKYPDVIVLQTSAASAGSRERQAALGGGGDSYLIEPIAPDELLATVNGLLRLRAAEQAARQVTESLERQLAERTRELAETNRRLDREIADRRQVEQVLWPAQKLEAVGHLTGGVAHDFNNLLTVILVGLEMARDALAGRTRLGPERILKLVNTAHGAAERGAHLTLQLLAFGRRTVLQSSALDLIEVIGGFAEFLRQSLGETITLDLSFAPGLWPSKIDPIQLEATILNLALNAREAMPEGGALTIATSNVVVDADHPNLSDELSQGSYVCVRISDTGKGMGRDIVEHAFEPFFTTKDVGKGSGLGLSQVYGFVKQSGGHVTIESAPGRGTTVSLYLPRADRPSDPRRAHFDPDAPDPTGHETILVVEDDEDVCELAVSIVSDLGYTALAASNAEKALEIIRSREPINLLFTDAIMPGGINGFDLAKIALSLRRDLKVLMTSGYAANHVEGVSADLPIIVKPYARAELAQKIRLILDAKGNTAAW